MVALVLLFAQGMVVTISHPFTTLLSHVNACVTILLTWLSLLAQLLFVWYSPSTRLVEAAAACSLAVVGVSALRMTVDVLQLIAAIRRRLSNLQLLLLTHTELGSDLKLVVLDAALIHDTCHDRNLPESNDPRDDDDEFMTDDDDMSELNNKNTNHTTTTDVVVLSIQDANFWDSAGGAIGTSLVTEVSDILATGNNM